MSIVKFNQSQIDLIKSQIAPKATDDELKLFLYQCQRTGLDPLTRQVYAIHRWNSQQGREVMTIQTSIDGLRLIAERSGEYAGQDEPLFIEEDGKVVAAKVTVHRFKGETRYPAATGVAYMTEYIPIDKSGQPMGLWKKMPRIMISKVAEALALRKAFPQDLSGIYAEEEMHQQDAGKIDADFDEVGDEKRDYLNSLIENSTYEERQRGQLRLRANNITKEQDYERAKATLLANQMEIEGSVNPSQKQINRKVQKLVNAEE
jgi:phage recombination protein Bet